MSYKRGLNDETGFESSGSEDQKVHNILVTSLANTTVKIELKSD
jgi:hypothetical protein